MKSNSRLKPVGSSVLFASFLVLTSVSLAAGVAHSAASLNHHMNVSPGRCVKTFRTNREACFRFNVESSKIIKLQTSR